MAGQDSDAKIAELLKQAYPPTAAAPEFKAQLRQRLNEQTAALAGTGSRPLWQQPFSWIAATAVALAAVALIIYLTAFRYVPPTVTTNEASDIGATAAILNGSIDSLGSNDNVEVSFEWGTSEAYGSETESEVLKTPGSVQAKLTGLAPETTYHFGAKAVGSQGAVHGQDMSFTTGSLSGPVVSTNEAAHLTADSAMLKGSLDDLGSAAAVSVSFQWGLTESYGNETIPAAMTTTGEYASELSGLSAGSTYHFRAKAVGDETVYGADVQFVAAAAPVTGPSVVTNDPGGVSTDSAWLNGYLSSLGSATSVSVSFEYGASSGSYTSSTPVQVMTSAGAFTAGLDGLIPGTTYFYRARVVGDGLPVSGEERRLTTSLPPTAPPSVVTDNASALTANSATLEADLSSLGTAENVSVSFEWGITTAYDNETTPAMRENTGRFTADLTGLDANTNYHFRAKALGDGVAYGADMTFTTGSVPPAHTTWYLSDSGSRDVNMMYDGDTSRPDGYVTLYSSGTPSSRIWRADQPSSSDMAYPAGSWNVRLLLSHIMSTHVVTVEVGTWDGTGGFLTYGSVTFLGQGDNDYVVYEYQDNVSVSSFNVRAGAYVATRITASAGHAVYVRVGDSRSHLQSPSFSDLTAPMIRAKADAEETADGCLTHRSHVDGFGDGGVFLHLGKGTASQDDGEVRVGSLAFVECCGFVPCSLAADTERWRQRSISFDATCKMPA